MLDWSKVGRIPVKGEHKMYNKHLKLCNTPTWAADGTTLFYKWFLVIQQRELLF